MVISSIKQAVAAKTDWVKTLEFAELPTLQLIVSNTTEAGLVYDAADMPDLSPPRSFPGKLTAMLYHRYKAFDGDPSKGLMILPLELVEDNGAILRKVVLKLARHWDLEDPFLAWLEGANTFYRSIVDRIVTGYPTAAEVVELQNQLNYEDKLLNVAELYHSWIIEGDRKLQVALPLDQAGLNIQFVSNIQNYFLRKVRILNGAHTSMVPIAYLSGLNEVKEAIETPLINIYIQNAIINEVIPFVGLPERELLIYKDTIIERFRNPFLRHKLLTISLYSTSKMCLRVLPSILGYYEKFNSLPPLLPFTFAAFLVFMRIREKSDSNWIGYRDSESYQYQDDPELLEVFYNAWRSIDPSKVDDLEQLVKTLCQHLTLWGSDLTELPQFVPIVTSHIQAILEDGMTSALKKLLVQHQLAE